MKKKIKKAMNRSGLEECPFCKQQHVLIEHHINGRDVMDFDGSWNIVNCCDCCHRLIHMQREIFIEGWFYTTKGYELVWHKEGEPNIIRDAAVPPPL